MAALFHVLGFTDSVHTCDCCGKTDLKGTFGIEMIETGEVLYYGSVCVTRNTGKTKKELKSMQDEREAAILTAAKAEYAAMGTEAALRAKLAECRAAKIPTGRAFKDYIDAELDADNAARKLVAEKHGIKVYQL
jgi:hypothetical protein